jgi:hypothetical protein
VQVSAPTFVSVAKPAGHRAHSSIAAEGANLPTSHCKQAVWLKTYSPALHSPQLSCSTEAIVPEGQSEQEDAPIAFDTLPIGQAEHSWGHGGLLVFKYRPTSHFSHDKDSVKYSPGLHREVGCGVGLEVGKEVGSGEGEGVGGQVGEEVGKGKGGFVGRGLGVRVGKRVGWLEGSVVGWGEGEFVGWLDTVGDREGDSMMTPFSTQNTVDTSKPLPLKAKLDEEEEEEADDMFE